MGSEMCIRDSAYVIGHSMGGKTAMALTLRYPQLIERLIVVDISPASYPNHHDAVLQGLKAITDTPHTSRRQADQTLGRFVSDPAIRAFLLTNLVQDGHAYTLRINLSAIMSEYRNIAAAIDPSSQPCLHPTLFIKGALSDYLDDGPGSPHKDAVLRLFPEAKLKIIGGAGHWPHAEKPDTFFRLAKEFLTAGN